MKVIGNHRLGGLRLWVVRDWRSTREVGEGNKGELQGCYPLFREEAL